MKTTRNLFKTTSVLVIAMMLGINANAQESKTNKLSVTVGEFYSLTLSNDNATILLDSEEKFANGSESEQISMTIFSSKKYAVTAQVSSENFSDDSGNTDVQTNNINLIVEKTSGNDEALISSRTNNSLKHSDAEQIASSSKATKADVYNLTYAIPAANTAAFLDQYGKTISTQITYTLLPL